MKISFVCGCVCVCGCPVCLGCWRRTRDIRNWFWASAQRKTTWGMSWRRGQKQKGSTWPSLKRSLFFSCLIYMTWTVKNLIWSDVDKPWSKQAYSKTICFVCCTCLLKHFQYNIEPVHSVLYFFKLLCDSSVAGSFWFSFS